MKAEYIGKCRDSNGYAVHLFYSYRGHEYMITDEHNGYSKTMAEKHREEQDRIDAILLNQNKNFKEEPAEIGLELFFESVGL